MRTRSSIACAQCREAKTKCNDYRPCSRCKHNGDADNCHSDQSQYQMHTAYVQNMIGATLGVHTDATANSSNANNAKVDPENNESQRFESEPGRSNSRDYTSERNVKRRRTSDANPRSQHALPEPARWGASPAILYPRDGASLPARLSIPADSQALAPSTMSHRQYCAGMASAAAATWRQRWEPTPHNPAAPAPAAMTWQMPDHHAHAAMAAAAAAVVVAATAQRTASAGLLAGGGAGGAPAPSPSAFPWSVPVPWPALACAQLTGAWATGPRPLGPGGPSLATPPPPSAGAWPPGPFAAGAFPFHAFTPGPGPLSGWDLPPRLAPLREPACGPHYAGPGAPDCARPPSRY